MPLNGPTPQDLQKLHAEVNQASNQRFVLTTLGVTLWGVVTAWQIPKVEPYPEVTLDTFTLISSMILMFVLFILFLYSHSLTVMIRIFTTYMITTTTSGWEKDWALYRKRQEKYRSWEYEQLQALVFMVLGFLTSALPFVICIIYSLKWKSLLLYIILMVVWVVYEVMLWFMGFKGFWLLEKEEVALENWNSLK